MFERFVFLESGKTTTLKHQIPHTKLNRFFIGRTSKHQTHIKNQITRIRNQTPNSIFQDKKPKEKKLQHYMRVRKWGFFVGTMRQKPNRQYHGPKSLLL
jgi:hypothetical protein